MALALIVGRGDRGLVERLGLQPVDERQTLLVDARDLDEEEAEALAASQVARVQVSDVAQAVPGAASGPVYVHIDVDVVDPTDMPGMGFPAAGGPSLAAVAEALAALAPTDRLCAVSFGMTFRADGLDAGGAAAATDRLAAVLV
jgi:arginase